MNTFKIKKCDTSLLLGILYRLMSQKHVINIEELCCPLSPWYPASYKNEIVKAHGPYADMFSLEVFAFYTTIIIYILIFTMQIRLQPDNIYVKQLTTTINMIRIIEKNAAELITITNFIIVFLIAQ